MGVHCLCDGYAPGDRQFAGLARQVGVGSEVGGVDGAVFERGGLEHIRQAHARPLTAAHGSHSPLVALGLGIEIGAAVATAFQLKRQGDGLEVLLQILDAQLEGVVDLAVHRQGPGQGVDGGRRNAVVANEQPVGRRDLIVQEMGRQLCVDRPVVKDDQPVLPLDAEGFFRHRGRYEAGRHVPMKRNRGAHHGRHGGEPGALQKAAAVRIGHPPEYQPVGLFRILGE